MPEQSPYETVEEDPEYFLELYELDLEELSVQEISERMDRPQELVQKELEKLKETIEEREIPEDYKEKFAEARAESVVDSYIGNIKKWSEENLSEEDLKEISWLWSDEHKEKRKNDFKSTYIKCF